MSRERGVEVDPRLIGGSHRCLIVGEVTPNPRRNLGLAHAFIDPIAAPAP